MLTYNWSSYYIRFIKNFIIKITIKIFNNIYIIFDLHHWLIYLLWDVLYRRFLIYEEIFYLSNLGEEIGLLFQLADDFLDIKSSKKLAGKTIGKDNQKGKSTLLNIMGYEKAFTYANNLKKKILLKLRKHGKNAKDLTKTIEFILGRNF